MVGWRLRLLGAVRSLLLGDEAAAAAALAEAVVVGSLALGAGVLRKEKASKGLAMC